MCTANQQEIKALGRSDWFLKLQILGKALGIASVLISMYFGAFAVAIGTVLIDIFEVIIRIIFNIEVNL